jgi:hypothetical protein
MPQSKIAYKKEIKLPHAVIRLRTDLIIEITSADDFEYDVDAIKQNHEAIKQLKETPKALILNLAGKFTTVTTEVRDFVATAPHQSFIAAEAFVIQSLAQKILVQFYLKMNKPKVPANFFNSATKAVEWLKNFG